MDYISKISEIFTRLNEEMLTITHGAIRFFEDNSFKEAAYSDLIPFHLSQEPQTFWDMLIEGGQGLYDDEFSEILSVIEAVENSFNQDKDELTEMEEGDVLNWIMENSEEFLDTMSAEFTRIRKSNS
jgi:hypothetical protein